MGSAVLIAFLKSFLCAKPCFKPFIISFNPHHNFISVGAIISSLRVQIRKGKPEGLCDIPKSGRKGFNLAGSLAVYHWTRYFSF